MCRVLCLVLACVFVSPLLSAAGEPTRPPDATLRQYLQALKDGKVEAAYDFISKGMRGAKSREDWTKEQREVGTLAEVKIFGFEVGSPKVDGSKAQVPNILRSQDKFINQMGLTEYELYTLVLEDGEWRIDQQLLVEPSDLPKWFPKLPKPGEPAKAP
jgi:hypothetical protein